MKNSLLFFTVVTLFTLQACQTGTDTGAEEAFDPAVIQGTWELTEYMPGDTSTLIPTDFRQYKIYTKDHFFFVGYNSDPDTIYVIGGGNYTIDRDSFTENLEFMTVDMSNAPTSLRFQHQIDGNTFAQSGVIPPLSGEGNAYVIEERYRKVEPGVLDSMTTPVYAGVWKLDQVKNGAAESLTAPPDSIGFYKIITDGHFLVVRYNKNNMAQAAVVFGTQKMENGKYVETILANSHNAAMNGVSVPYEAEGGEATFAIKGAIPMEGGDYPIEEHYSRIE